MGEVLPRYKSKFSAYELIADTGGKFEVLVDGKVLYSKLETGRFPENHEVLKLLDEQF
jgi:selenoprotein W-related protein